MPARKRRTFGKRSMIASGLILFVIVMSVVVWRRSIGVSNAQKIARLERHRAELLTEQTTLNRDISDAMNYRRVEVEAAKRLGMHVATERERRYLRDVRAAADSVEHE